MWQTIKLWSTVVLGVLLLIFLIQNFATVELSLLFWGVSMPGSFLALILFFIGFGLGWMWSSETARRRREG